MACSKQKLSAAMKRTCLNLNDKIKVLDYKVAHPKIGVRDLGREFGVGKTAAADILKNATQLRADFEFFRVKLQKTSSRKIPCHQRNYFSVVHQMLQCKRVSTWRNDPGRDNVSQIETGTGRSK